MMKPLQCNNIAFLNQIQSYTAMLKKQTPGSGYMLYVMKKLVVSPDTDVYHIGLPIVTKHKLQSHWYSLSVYCNCVFRPQLTRHLAHCIIVADVCTLRLQSIEIHCACAHHTIGCIQSYEQYLQNTEFKLARACQLVLMWRQIHCSTAQTEWKTVHACYKV